MLASKYFPHYFGLNMLYHHLFRVRERERGEPRGNTPGIFYIIFAAAFLVANPAVLLPQTWAYLNAYSSEQLLTHHGYLMGETLYHNVVSKTPFGATPVYFYALFLLIKTPPLVLVAFAAGLFALARRWREPGPAFMLFMFLCWIVPYSVMGAKWLRYTLSLLPFVYMIAAVGVVAAARGTLALLKINREQRPAVASLVGACVLSLFVGVPAWATTSRTTSFTTTGCAKRFASSPNARRKALCSPTRRRASCATTLRSSVAQTSARARSPTRSST